MMRETLRNVDTGDDSVGETILVIAREQLYKLQSHSSIMHPVLSQDKILIVMSASESP